MSLISKKRTTLGGPLPVRVEAGAIMGLPPLEPDRCYVIVRAGRDRESERRAFEVRDLAVSSERTSVLVVGRNYGLPRSARP